MARTYGRIKVEIWESGSDYRRLPTAAQWVYQMLVSQPNITQAGVLNYAPRKWARLSSDMTPEIIEQLVGVLEQAGYLILDSETEELLVRSFIKHDEPWRLRNNLTSARTQFRAIESGVIQRYLSERHPWLSDLDMEPDEIEKNERDYVRSNARSNDRSNARSGDTEMARTSQSGAEGESQAVNGEETAETSGKHDRSNERFDDRSNGVLLAGVASDYPEPDPSKGREVQGSTPPPAAHEAAPSAQRGSECPLCGELPRKVDLEDHLANVHGVEDPERLLASRAGVA